MCCPLLIDRIDRFLDMECTINVKTEMRMFQFKTFATTPVPASLTIGTGHVEDLFYIPDISRDDRDMQMFLKESGATRSGDLMVFRVNEFDFDPLLLFEDLVAIPSVVINYKIFMAGTHIINFRFHSSNLDQVTNFMSRAFSAFKNFEITFFGKTKGVRNIFAELNRILPLYYLSLTVHVPDTDIELVSRASIKWIREQKYKSKDGDYSAVYYFDGPVKKDPGLLTVIDEEHGIYCRKSQSRIISQYMADFISQSYPSFLEIQSLSENQITIETIVSSGVVSQHLLTLKNLVAKFQNWDLEINSVIPYKKV